MVDQNCIRSYYPFRRHCPQLWACPCGWNLPPSEYSAARIFGKVSKNWGKVRHGRAEIQRAPYIHFRSVLGIPEMKNGLSAQPDTRNIVFFDGVCNLCNFFADWLI